VTTRAHHEPGVAGAPPPEETTMSSTRRPLGTRTALVLLGLLALLVLVGACSRPAADEAGAGAAGSDDGSSAANRAQAVRFATCMRSNGVAGFPDPDASGDLTLDAAVNGSSLDPGSSTFTEAMTACADLAPPGFTGRTRTEQEQGSALAFAQCIRDHGVADFPDPTPGAPLVDTNRIPSVANGDLSVLDAAMQTCHDDVADLLDDQ
jgi:hypothetical protein